MRGKVKTIRRFLMSNRITPAYAGKSGKKNFPAGLRKDHPRVCGEKLGLLPSNRFLQGSPPRMRGKVTLPPWLWLFPGITPAYAGKSREADLPHHPLLDHPRVCGEKHERQGSGSRSPGSPPRMRGKAGLAPSRLLPPGITPAYAGKSQRLHKGCAMGQDHPRVCGEKKKPTTNATFQAGSPPRMRGKGL